MATKLRVIVADDLTPGQVAAQAVHAATMFAKWHRASFEDWTDGSNIIVILVATNDQLHTIHQRTRDAGITMASFLEPDMDDKLTAIALGPDKSGLVRELTCGLALYGAPPKSSP